LGRIGMGYEVFPIKPKCLHSNDLPKFVLQFRSCEDQRLNPCLRCLLALCKTPSKTRLT